MFVNNVDVSIYKARLLTKQPKTGAIVSYREWLRGAIQPILSGQDIQDAPLILDIYVKGDTEQETQENISNLVAQFKKCTIKFDELDFYFDCVLDSVDSNRVTKLKYQLTFNLICSCKYKDTITIQANAVASITINNPGNLEAPEVIEITPNVNIGSITVGDFTINNLTAGKMVIVNTEDWTVLENGINKYGDFDGDFPTLEPGTNTITISNTSCNVLIKFKPRWQ